MAKNLKVGIAIEAKEAFSGAASRIASSSGDVSCRL